MNRHNFSRHEAALSIDELLSVSDRRQPTNWMLTYLDVFVLIVMLVVTLISFSNFETTPASTQPSAEIEPVEPSEAVQPPPLPTERTTKQSTETISVEIQNAINPDNSSNQKPEAVNQPVEVVANEIPPLETEANSQQASTSAEKTLDPLEQDNLQEKLNQQLEALGLTDSINMTVSLGYAQLEIQDNILYRSSEATLTANGKSILGRLTPLLQQSSGLIYIEGHTDNRPINTSKFPSNWELGAARATSVLHFLASQQLPEARMRAVTYAATKPIADNGTEQGRRKNRRVNIVIKVSDKID